MKPKGYSRLFAHSAAATAVIVATLAAPSARAASATWNGTTSAIWSDATNWSGPLVTAPGTGDTATFNNAGNSNTTLDLGAGVTISSVVFDTAASAAYTLGSGAVGSQTLVLNNAGAVTVNATVANNQLVNANLTLGTVATAQSFSFTNNSPANSLAFAGAIANSSTGAAYDQIKFFGAGSTSMSGAIGGTNGLIYIDKYEAGTATLSGASNFIGSINIHAGKMVWSGTNTSVVAATTGGWIALGDTAATKSRLDITGGSLTRYDFGITSNATGIGAVYQSGGSFTLTRAASTNDFRLGSVAGGYGYYSLSGAGSTFTTNEAGIGGLFNDSTGVMDVSGGTFTSNGWITLGRGGLTSSGLLNVTGGLVEFSKTAGAADANNSRLGLQWGGSAGAQSVVNIANCTVTGDDYIDLAVTNTAGTLGAINILSGGLLQGSRVTAAVANPTALLNFNGGTLRANGTNAGVNFMNSGNIDGVYVYGSGGTVDNNNTAITVGKPLLAPTGNGVSTVPVSGGTGYLGAPLVKISGDGTGATGYATINSNGDLTGITVTNPGTGYTTATATLTGGGGAGGTVGTITLAANSSGGMKFQGAGTTTLSVASTYTGATTINSGTLTLGASGDINSSSAITINGSGAKLVQTSATAISTPVTLTQGSVDGNSTINSLTVANAVGNTLSAGNGGTGALTVDSLTFQGAATVNVTATGTSMIRNFAATTLATNAAGQVVVNVTNTNGFWTPGDYPVITYSTSFSGDISHFLKGTVPGLSGGQTATLVNTGGAIVLRIVGDSLTWTAAQSLNWTTGIVGGLQNWKYPSTNTPAEFSDGNPVLFDDTTNDFSVNLASNVSPSITVFNNTDPNTYFISSTGGFGITGGSLVKGGSGTVVMTTTNTYTGTTLINAGVLQIGDGVTDGSILTSSSITNNASLVMMLSGSQTLTNPISGSGVTTMNGTGTLTLAVANTFTGGVALTTGTLNVNHASALGSTTAGTLTINGGILNNASGAAITTTAAKAQTWAGDFTFTGSNNLNFNSGVVTLTGGGSRTVNVAAGILATGAFTSTGTGLSLTGPGLLTITSATASNIGGTLDVAAGAKLRINTGADGAATNDFIAAGLTGSGTVENGGGVERWLFANPATDQTFTGLLQNGATGALGFNKGGAGILTLTGTNTYTGRTSITAGTLSVATISNAGFASPIGAAGVDPGSIYIGNNAGTGTLLYTGADVTLDRGFTTAANVANSGVIDTNANMTFTGVVTGVNAGGFIKRGTGILTLSNGGTTQKLSNGTNGGTSVLGVNVALGKLALQNGTFATVGETVVGGQLQTGGVYTAASLDITNAGTLTVPNWVSIGRGNGTTGLSSVLTVDGGTLSQTLATAGLAMGFDAAVAGFNAAPVLTAKGASTVNVAGNLNVGESLGSDATINVQGTSIVNLTNATQANKSIGLSGKGTLNLTSGTVNAGSGLTVGKNAGGEGVIRLDGGILDTASIIGGLGTSTFHFNGGSLRANATVTTFLQGLTTASVDAGGALIDTPVNVTIAQPLTAGTGAAGLTKSGVGILTLGGVNTYVGNTTVNAGTLALADNAGLKFVIGANGVNNKLTGAGATTLDGDFTLDLTGAAIANGNSWTLVDTATKSFTANFTVAGGFTELGDVWTKVDGSNTWTFSEATGTLSLSVSATSGFGSWITGFGLAAADQDPTDDPDNDGINNLMEYVLGGNPSSSNSSIKPTGGKVGSNYVFIFNRSDLSLTAGDVTDKVEYGNNLVGWTEVAVPAASGTVGAVSFTVADGSPTDTVTATIPTAGATTFFARLKVVK